MADVTPSFSIGIVQDKSYARAPQNPDREKTNRDYNSIAPPVEQQEYSLDLALVGNDRERDQDFRQVEKHLYQRKFGGWYAKLPDQKLRGTRQIPARPPTTTSQPERIDSWRSFNNEQVIIKNPQSTLMLLKLPWKMEKYQDRRRLVVYRFHDDFKTEEIAPNSAGTSPHEPGVPNIRYHANPPIQNGQLIPLSSISTTAPASDAPNPPTSLDQRQASSCQSRTSQSLLWQHTEYQSLSLMKLRKQVEYCKAHGVSDSEFSLFTHVNERLSNDFELSFVGGKYLQPATLRYDIQFLDLPTVDQSCVFFNFPYLSLLRPGSLAGTVDEFGHPPRTLLQSRYRRLNTKDRDRAQGVSSMSLEDLQNYLLGSLEDMQNGLRSISSSAISRRKKRHLLKWLLSFIIPPLGRDRLEGRLYIPQLWGFLPGSNNLITSGISDVESLCGDHLRLCELSDRATHSAPALLNLSFCRSGQPEELFYPMDRCNSWYGLLNKHLTLEELIDKAKAAKHDAKVAESSQKSDKSHPEDGSSGQKGGEILFKREKVEFELQLEEPGITLEPKTWISTLKQRSQEETFTVRNVKHGRGSLAPKAVEDTTPRTPAADAVNTSRRGSQLLTVPLEAGSSDASPLISQQDMFKTPSMTSTKSQKSEGMPIFKNITFLEWPMQDEFHQNNRFPIRERASLFLDCIYEKMSVAQHPTVCEVTPIAKESHTAQKISFVPASFPDVQTWIMSKDYHDDGSKAVAARALHSSRCLLAFFIPDRLMTHSTPLNGIRLFWGSLMELIETSTASTEPHKSLGGFCDSIERFIKIAKKLHEGVIASKRESVPGSAAQTVPVSGLMPGAILLSAIIEALELILGLIVKYLDASVKDEETIDAYVQAICKVLENAEGQLIREADRKADSETPGPLLTPEAASIALMDRLVSGTCGRASLNVVGMYEFCLEKMALKVKFEASRRLMTKINGFIEEVAIIGDVLKQQTNVLLQFRESLKPDSFYNPAISRRLQFPYESQEIDRILLKIREQIRAFRELQERAKQLAKENVQLVETSQDQNSKYLFVFTVVTVLFLPPSFVAGFFGMNLEGINPAPWPVAHFWEIAVPLTVGVILLALVFARTIDDMLAAWSRWWSKRKPRWLGT